MMSCAVGMQGSIKDKTKSIAHLCYMAWDVKSGDRTLSECFALFGLIHSVTTTHAIITRITREVIEDFASDNVLYLELRTTPKASCSTTNLAYHLAITSSAGLLTPLRVLE